MQLYKNYKSAGIVRIKDYERIIKKENGLIIISVLSVSDKKT